MQKCFLSKPLTSIYLYTRKGSFFSSYPLDNDILLLVSRQSYRWMYKGHSKGRLQSRRQLVETLQQFYLGTRSFTEKATVGSLRDYDLLIYGSLLKRPCLMTVLFVKATNMGYPRGVYVEVCYVQLFFCVFCQVCQRFVISLVMQSQLLEVNTYTKI